MQEAMDALNIQRVMAMIKTKSTNPNKRLAIQVGYDPLREDVYVDLRVAYDNGSDHGISYTRSGFRVGLEFADDIIAALQRAKKESGTIQKIIRAARSA